MTDLKSCVELLSAAKGWELDVLAVFIGVDHEALQNCMLTNVWPQDIEDKVLEHFTDVISTNRDGFRAGQGLN